MNREGRRNDGKDVRGRRGGREGVNSSLGGEGTEAIYWKGRTGGR